MEHEDLSALAATINDDVSFQQSGATACLVLFV